MDDTARGCFKIGCIGCLSLVALGVGLAVLFGVLGMVVDPGDPVPEKRELARELPPVVGEPGSDSTEPLLVEALPITPGQPARSGRIVLDLSAGEFTVTPGPAGEPVRIEADYDSRAFDLKEELTTNDDGSFTYEVRLTGKGGGFLGRLFGGHDGSKNRVDVILPRGRPLEIVGKIGMGTSKIDLGGLWLRRVDLELGMGDHFLELREPLPVPMESFHLDSSMGNIEVRSLGNASPATVEVNHSMGEILVDLKGSWHNDAEVDIDFSLGECRVWLPEDVHVDVASASLSVGEKAIDTTPTTSIPDDAPTLTLHLSGSMGGIEVER